MEDECSRASVVDGTPLAMTSGLNECNGDFSPTDPLGYNSARSDPKERGDAPRRDSIGFSKTMKNGVKSRWMPRIHFRGDKPLHENAGQIGMSFEQIGAVTILEALD
jgi:hypothetical protein